MFVHTVFFWLRPNAPASARDAIIREARQSLSKIPSVRHLFAGEPALTPREVVDNTYDIGLTIVFDSRAGHDEYQAHPLHKAFVEHHQDHWQRITVYDYQ